MLRSLLLSLLLSVAASASDAVLLIGVGEYQVKYFTTLQGPKPTFLPGIDKDVAMMHQTALRLGFREDQITTLSNETATLDAIRKALAKLIAAAGPGDRVLIYFSGHGAQVPDQSPFDEKDGQDESLVPYDFLQNASGLANVLVDDELGALLRQFKTTNVLLILDSCHSGTADKSFTLNSAKSVSASQFVPKQLPTEWQVSPRSFTVSEANSGSSFTTATTNYLGLMAAQEDEFANATGQGSVMTVAVARAVEQAIQSNTPITVDGLHRRAVVESERFRAEMARLRPDQPVKQTPQIRGDLARKGINIRKMENRFAMVEEWADSVPDKLVFKTNKVLFRVDDPLEIKIPRIPRTGYLNLVQVSEETQQVRVLFPHVKHPDNAVTAGQEINLPFPDGDYDFAAKLPEGLHSQRMLLVAFVSEQPLNLFQDAGQKNVLFPVLPSKDEKDFELVPGTNKKRAAMYAGKLTVDIKK